MVICLERGADLHMAQLIPLPLTDNILYIVIREAEKKIIKESIIFFRFVSSLILDRNLRIFSHTLRNV